jgi:hypothetical protein
MQSFGFELEMASVVCDRRGYFFSKGEFKFLLEINLLISIICRNPDEFGLKTLF